MTKTATRLKTKAQIYVPQSKDDAAADIRKIGDIQRESMRTTAEMNDAIAVITHNTSRLWTPWASRSKPCRKACKATAKRTATS